MPLSGGGGGSYRAIIRLGPEPMTAGAPHTTRAQSTIDHCRRTSSLHGTGSSEYDSYNSVSGSSTSSLAGVSSSSTSPTASPPYSPGAHPYTPGATGSSGRRGQGSFTKRAALHGYPWGPGSSTPIRSSPVSPGGCESPALSEAGIEGPPCTGSRDSGISSSDEGGFHTALTNGHDTDHTILPAGFTFHLSMNGSSPAVEAAEKKKPAEEEHPFFTGRRDVRRNETTTSQRRIVSSKGTIRGIKNMVRAGIATFMEQQDQAAVAKKNQIVQEQGRIVLYSTSVMIVRDTYDKCKKVRQMLQTHMVQYEERDIFMSRENQKELAERLNTQNGGDVPQVFANGQHLGGMEEIERLNESGELRKIFLNFKRVSNMTSCDRCGGYRYVPCPHCHGSKKSLHRNHFTEEFCALRCIACDENGLVKCDNCIENDRDTA